MPLVGEDNEIREYVQGLLRNDGDVTGQTRQPFDGRRVLGHLTMTHHALGRRREAGPIAGGCFSVAVQAFDFQPGVPLMAEGQGLRG